MKPIKTFKIGSSAFFSNYTDYSPKDIDELNIVDVFPFKTNSIQIKGLHGKDVFFFRNMSKEEFIKDTLNSNLPMSVGKFIVPEFAKHIGLTIKDLKLLEKMFNNLDEPHMYEKLIFDFYIENNAFYLTDKQKSIAYYKYKETR